MPCILWITCDCSSEQLIETVALQPYKIIEKGSVVETRDGEKRFDHTLCGFDVSTKDFTEFEVLVKDATQWLSDHYGQLEKLADMGATVKLDFGFYTKFVDSKIVAQYDSIPWQLMKIAGDLKIDIELSQYWYTEDQGAQLN